MENIKKLEIMTKMLNRRESIIEKIMEYIPSFAMIINKERKVIFANKKALDAGAVVGDFCWKTFGQMDFISLEDKQYMLTSKSSKGMTRNIHCYFCKSDDCLAQQVYKSTPDVVAFDRIWDTYWIPIDEETFLHYAYDVTHLLTEEQIIKIREKAEIQIKEMNNETTI